MFDYISTGTPAANLIPSGAVASYLDKATGNVYYWSQQGWHQVLQSAADALTALVGGGQSGATAIVTRIARFTTVATAGNSAILPAAIPGLTLTVINAAASNSMNVFPASGETINALTQDAAFAVAANKTALFSCAKTGQWNSILTA